MPFVVGIMQVYQLISRPNLRQSSLETLEPIATGSNDDYARYISVGEPTDWSGCSCWVMCQSIEASLQC